MLRAGLLLLPLLACSDPAPVDAPEGGDGVDWSCDADASLSSGSELLSNTVWNAGEAGGSEQCIAILDDEPQRTGFAWRWRWPWPGRVPTPESHPGIVFGWQPWRSASTTKQLPRRVGDLERLRVSYRAFVQAEGVYNLAFDLWLTDEERVSPERVTKEVMVWVLNSGMEPAARWLGTVRIDDRRYDLYASERRHLGQGRALDWQAFTFVAETPQTEGDIALEEILGHLIERGFVSDDEWLASVQLGTEIAGGSGGAQVRDYRVDVTLGGG